MGFIINAPKRNRLLLGALTVFCVLVGVILIYKIGKVVDNSPIVIRKDSEAPKIEFKSETNTASNSLYDMISKDVKQDINTQPADKNIAYYIVFATVDNKQEALDMSKMLKENTVFKNHNIMVVKATNMKPEKFRIQIGPFTSIHDAKNFCKTVPDMKEPYVILKRAVQ